MLATSYKNQQKWNEYSSVLLRALKVAKRINSPEYEQIQLELVKHRLFEEANPEAASEILSEISNSTNPHISRFGRIWSQVLRIFPAVKSIWGFLTQADQQETKFIVRGKEPHSIIVTKLAIDESHAEEPTSFTSDLFKRPEILQISKLSSYGKRGKYSFEDFKIVQRKQQERLEKARSFRQQGRIAAAIEALEQYFTDHIDIATETEILGYDHDPEIQKMRVGDWIQNLDWRTFELEIAQLFVRMGYSAHATKASGDGGVDVRAVKNGENIVIQCKHWKQQKVGLETVQALSAIKISEEASRALLITSFSLEPNAKRWALQNEVEVIEGPRLVELFIEHCNPERLNDDFNLSPKPSANLLNRNDVGTNDQLVLPSDLTPRDQEVLNLFSSKTKVRNQDIQELLGISRTAASARLKRLVDKDYLIMHNTRSLAFYTKKEDLD